MAEGQYRLRWVDPGSGERILSEAEAQLEARGLLLGAHCRSLQCEHCGRACY